MGNLHSRRYNDTNAVRIPGLKGDVWIPFDHELVSCTYTYTRIQVRIRDVSRVGSNGRSPTRAIQFKVPHKTGKILIDKFKQEWYERKKQWEEHVDIIESEREGGPREKKEGDRMVQEPLLRNKAQS